MHYLAKFISKAEFAAPASSKLYLVAALVMSVATTDQKLQIVAAAETGGLITLFLADCFNNVLYSHLVGLGKLANAIISVIVYSVAAVCASFITILLGGLAYAILKDHFATFVYFFAVTLSGAILTVIIASIYAHYKNLKDVDFMTILGWSIVLVIDFVLWLLGMK